mmetsp:Transcript_26355/g.41698  ORF Transcript_26355/g.41698 Transcript_26355/m.41698 type:complete len:112 (-) Transcript_26355:270-605(-)
MKDPAEKIRERYRMISNAFGTGFWFLIFFFTNFIFLFLTLNDFALGVAEWYVITVVFVTSLVVVYIAHLFYGCMANQVLSPEQYRELNRSFPTASQQKFEKKTSRKPRTSM